MPFFQFFKIVVCFLLSLSLLACGSGWQRRIQHAESDINKQIADVPPQKALVILQASAEKGDIPQKIAVANTLGKMKKVNGVYGLLSQMLHAPSNDYYYRDVRYAALDALGEIDSLETNMMIYDYGLKNIRNNELLRKIVAVYARKKKLPLAFAVNIKAPQNRQAANNQYFAGRSGIIRFTDKGLRGSLEITIPNVQFMENRWTERQQQLGTDHYRDSKGMTRSRQVMREYYVDYARKTVHYKASITAKDTKGNILIEKEYPVSAEKVRNDGRMPDEAAVFASSLYQLENAINELLYPRLPEIEPLAFITNIAAPAEEVNWEAAEVTLPPLLKAAIRVESKGAVAAGSAVNLNLTVKNEGRGPAYRLLGIVKAKNISVPEQRTPMGKINPGEEKSTKITVNIPLQAESAEVPVEISFKEANDYPPDAVGAALQVVNLPRPHLSYAYVIIDDMERSTKAVGNGDGVFQLGEAVEMRFTVKNTGESTAENVHFLLDFPKSLEGKGFVLENPSGKLGNLAPHEEKILAAVLVAKKTLTQTDIPLQIKISETFMKVQTTDTINLRIGEETKAKVIALSPRTAFVSKDKAEVLSAADAQSGAVFRLAASTPVKVTAQLGLFYRVDLGQGRQGWMNKETVSFQKPQDGKKPAAGDEPALLPKVIEVFRNSPPTVYIASPKDGFRTQDEAIKLESFIFDAAGLKTVALAVNGQPLDIDETRGIALLGKDKESHRPLATVKNKNEYAIQLSVPLQEGRNKIEIKVENEADLTTTKSVSVERVKYLVARLPRIRALLVGVNEYDESIPSLSYAEADARSFRETLRGPQIGVKEEDLVMLLGKSATRENILKNLDRLLTGSHPDDLVILYFATHGYPDPEGADELYFMPSGATMADFRINAVARSDIRRFLKASRAGKILFIADACHASSVSASSDVTRNIPGRLVPLLVKLSDVQGKGIGFLTAASANEVSREDKRYRHGLFTYFLIQGLSGEADKKPWGDADGFVTVGEVSEYIRRHVHDITGGRQNPSFDPNSTLPREVPLSQILRKQDK